MNIAALEQVTGVNFIALDELKYFEEDTDDDEEDHSEEEKLVNEIVISIFDAKNQKEVNQIMNSNLETFTECIKIYTCREVFVEIFKQRASK